MGTPKLPISPNGTGDLFAALFVAARVQNKDTPDALGHAASAIFAVLERTAARGTEEMRIVESGELLVRPPRRFEPSQSAFEAAAPRQAHLLDLNQILAFPVNSRWGIARIFCAFARCYL